MLGTMSTTFAPKRQFLYQLDGFHTHQLLLILVLTILFLLLGRFRLLPLHTAWAPTTKRRREREIDVLLRVESDDEGWYVDDLLADTRAAGKAIS
jgi:hypothetical protein